MQDPSYGVAGPLQNHIHLISGHQFPLVAHLNLETAFKYLLDAPIIVKQTAPMSWTYVNAPNDGTIWLEWLSPTKNNRLPTDGYIYGDPESTYRQEYGGYTIEVMVHNLGYKPGEHLAAHSRTRYHFISKAPNVNAAAPDPSLWIVHYTQAQQRFIMPSQQIPVDHHVKVMMHERSILQSQGRLERKDFMLHDREHWPQIHGPSGGQMGHNMMAQGFYGANPQPMGQPGGRYRNNSVTGPPSKRPRMNDPTASHDGAHDTSIEDEENTALGDYFDHLTPRDISMARYMQHHRWMEEVFSSPYATGQIVPADLGLGLVGELKHLTDGILEPPSTDLERAGERPLPPKAKEAQPFTNLKKEQLEDFNKRIQKHLDDGQAEIERMKAEHAAKMQEWKKSKTLLQAEKRLRNATWEGHEAAVYRLEEPATNGRADKHETVEDVVTDVESLLGVKLAGHQDATLIEKGGLEEPQQPPPPQPEPQENRQSTPPPQQPQGFQPAASPYSQPGPQQQLQPQSMSQPSVSPAPSQQQQQAQVLPPQQQQQMPQAATQQQTMQAGNDMQMPDSMDLDPSTLDFSTGTVDNSSAPTPSTSNQPPQQQQQPPSTTNTPGAGNDTTLDFQQEGSMFADSFNDFAGDLGAGGDGDGDGLIDFEGGLDNSAFGDAIHGMDEGDGMFGDGNGGS